MNNKIEKGLILLFILISLSINIVFPLSSYFNKTAIIIHGLFFLITFICYFFIRKLGIKILNIGWQITCFGFFIHTFDEFFTMPNKLEVLLEGVLTTIGLFLVTLGITKTVKKFQEYSNRYKSLFRGNHAVMFLIDPDTGDIIDANQAALSYYGYSREELLKKKIYQIRVSSKKETFEKMEQARKEEQEYFHFKHRLASGEIRDVEVYSGPLSIDGKELLYSIVHDITDRIQAQKSLAESEKKYRTLFNQANDAIFLLEYSEEKGFGKIISANKAAYNRLRYRKDSLVNQSPQILIEDNDIAKLPKVVAKLKEKGNIVFQITQLSKDGKKIPTEVNAHLCTIDGKPTILAISRDISERKKHEESLKYLSFHDELTGLYNRRYIENEISRLNDSRKIPISLIMTDLDKFKEINDTYGHKIGDMALKIMANIIEDVVREEDIVGRLGGDEFVIILPETDNKTAAEICNRIEKRAEEYSQNQKFRLSISTGYVTKNNPSIQLDKLLIEADKEMYKNKREKEAVFYS